MTRISGSSVLVDESYGGLTDSHNKRVSLERDDRDEVCGDDLKFMSVQSNMNVVVDARIHQA